MEGHRNSRPPSRSTSGTSSTGRPLSERPSSSSSSRPQSISSDRPRSENPRGWRPDRAGATRSGISKTAGDRSGRGVTPRTPMERSQDPTRFRLRIFESMIPDEAREWFEKCASIDSDESTDAAQRALYF